MHRSERRLASKVDIDKVLQTCGVEIVRPFARNAETRKLDARAGLLLCTGAACCAVEIGSSETRCELAALTRARLETPHEEFVYVALLGIGSAFHCVHVLHETASERRRGASCTRFAQNREQKRVDAARHRACAIARG